MLTRRTSIGSVRWVLRRLSALVVPPACVVCRSALPRADLVLCPPCVRALPWLPAGVCLRCSLPAHRGRRCPALGAGFATSRAVVMHEGVARSLVIALKFRGFVGLADLMAAQMSARIRLPPNATLVAVPSVPARRRARGFDPADRLARALAARTGLPYRAALRRIDRTHQVGAGRGERRAAGRVRFATHGAVPALAVLVDDVHTTGATLDAAAQALRGAGCARVEAVTYARAL